MKILSTNVLKLYIPTENIFTGYKNADDVKFKTDLEM
jgi:hypothetical protein